MLAALAGCGPKSSTTAATPTALPGAVGYVRMNRLVHKHPLYRQLSRFDDDIVALELRTVGGGPGLVGADLRREEQKLQTELDAAGARTKKILADKQAEYQKREQAAIAAALGTSVTGGNAGAIAGGVARTAGVQAKNAASEADRALATYRDELLKSDRATIETFRKNVNDEAARRFRAKSDDLQQKESNFALEAANANAAERLSLRTRLANLALEDAQRAEARARLDALERKESDDLAALRNRDAAALAAFEKQLQAESRSRLEKEAGAVQARSKAKLEARERQLRGDLIGQLRGVPPPAGGLPAPPSGMSGNQRAKLETIHKQFQSDFNRDAHTTVKEFEATRRELTKRFERLHGVDRDAQADAQKHIAGLQKQRDDLYAQMVAAIEREVKVVANRRRVAVVFSDPIAPVSGVDLTPDAEKDIESLHE